MKARPRPQADATLHSAPASPSCRFHEAVRPLEGRMKVPQASRTAPRGAPYTG